MREQDLDDLFAEARAQEPLASGALFARVMADADRVMPRLVTPLRGGVVSRKPSLWAQLAVALGGKGVLAGLGTVAAAGMMLGFAQPASIAAVTDTIFAQSPLEELDLFPGVDAILTEG